MSVQCVVVGAGVVGLAVARSLAMAGLETLVLERHGSIGTETSSRNSEVIHAGIYYPEGSLKARVCVEGKHALYQFCEDHGVDYKRCGKLIVATDEAEEAALLDITRKARANGVHDLELLTGAEAKAYEPEVHCRAALRSPSTGIVDSHGFMLELQGAAELHGATVCFRSPVLSAEPVDGGRGGIRLEVGGDDGDPPYELICDHLINACGLGAPQFAGLLHSGGSFADQQYQNQHEQRQLVPTVGHYAKGNYYRLSGCRTPFKGLVYPVPQQAGLGVHATVDLGGTTRFGPDVEWMTDPVACGGAPLMMTPAAAGAAAGAGAAAAAAAAATTQEQQRPRLGSYVEPDYTVDPSRADSFYDAVRQYWPDLPDGSLEPDYAGIRPKLQAPGEPAKDFLVVGATESSEPGGSGHGIAGLVHLLGIESPGLTSSLAIGEYTRQVLLAEGDEGKI